MNETFKQVPDLIKRGKVRISDHGYDELAEEDIFVRDIMAGVSDAVLVHQLSWLPLTDPIPTNGEAIS